MGSKMVGAANAMVDMAVQGVQVTSDGTATHRAAEERLMGMYELLSAMQVYEPRLKAVTERAATALYPE